MRRWTGWLGRRRGAGAPLAVATTAAAAAVLRRPLANSERCLQQGGGGLAVCLCVWDAREAQPNPQTKAVQLDQTQTRLACYRRYLNLPRYRSTHLRR